MRRLLLVPVVLGIALAGCQSEPGDGATETAYEEAPVDVGEGYVEGSEGAADALEADLLSFRLDPTTLPRWAEAVRALVASQAAPGWNAPDASPADRLQALEADPAARDLLAASGFEPRAFVFATAAVERVQEAEETGAIPLTHPDNVALVREQAAALAEALGALE